MTCVAAGVTSVRASIVSVKELLPCGMRKVTVPVVPVVPAATLMGKVSLFGELMMSPDFKRAYVDILGKNVLDVGLFKFRAITIKRMLLSACLPFALKAEVTLVNVQFIPAYWKVIFRLVVFA